MNIRRDVIDDIRAHAQRDHPRECCGILIASGHDIVEAVAATNVAAEPSRRYEVSPADHFAQMKRCRAAGARSADALRIAGVYHSHPHSAPVPSATDLEQAFEEYLYVIAGPVDGSAPLTVRAFRLERGRFCEVQLTATPTAGAG
jgi:proteasome lid subunit RPN8/RPN11